MVSAHDIPAHLLSADARTQYVAWLRKMPVPLSVKRRLNVAWEDAAGARLTADERDETYSTPGADH